MRRLVTVCTLALLAVCLSPVPAHAYFWEWLDSLSGPRFGGVVFEAQVLCDVRNVSDSPRALQDIDQRLGVERDTYAKAVGGSSREARPFVENAVRYRNAAQAFLDRALELKRSDPKADVTSLVLDALAWQTRAAQHFDWAQRLGTEDRRDPRKQPGSYTSEVERVERTGVSTRSLPLAGVRYSFCDYKPLDRDRFFLSAVVGFGVDIKNDDEHSPGRHKMLTTGASVHWVARPWVTLGAGAGLATFFTSGSGTFAKPYIQPYIIDVRPGAFVSRADVRSPWRHFVFVRYSTLTFPKGFDRGAFSPNSPAYPTELVHQLGIHFDLTAVLRGQRGNW